MRPIRWNFLKQSKQFWTRVYGQWYGSNISTPFEKIISFRKCKIEKPSLIHNWIAVISKYWPLSPPWRWNFLNGILTNYCDIKNLFGTFGIFGIGTPSTTLSTPRIHTKQYNISTTEYIPSLISSPVRNSIWNNSYNNNNNNNNPCACACVFVCEIITVLCESHIYMRIPFRVVCSRWSVCVMLYGWFLIVCVCLFNFYIYRAVMLHFSVLFPAFCADELIFFLFCYSRLAFFYP